MVPKIKRSVPFEKRLKYMILHSVTNGKHKKKMYSFSGP
jgi:hypothetical protein